MCFIARKFSRVKIATMPLKSAKGYYLLQEEINFAMKMSHVRLSSSCRGGQTQGLQTHFLFLRIIFPIKLQKEASKA